MKVIADIRTVKTVINGETFYHTEVKYLRNIREWLTGFPVSLSEWEKVEIVDA